MPFLIANGGAGVAASITLPAVAGKIYTIQAIVASYGAAGVGTLTVQVGGVDVFSTYVGTMNPLVYIKDIPATAENQAVTVSLSGIALIASRLCIQYREI